MGRLRWILIIFLGFFGISKVMQKKVDENQKVSEAEAYTQPEVVKDSSTTDWWELGSTDLGHWVQETLNLSGTEANVTLWITFTLLLITFLSYILDLKALRGKIKINVSLGITLFFIISVIVYGIAFKGEAVQKWMDDFSFFGERVDRTPKLWFRKIGQSENITMTINTELRVVLPPSRVDSGLVTEVCFELVGPPLLKEHKDLPKEILRNLNGTASGTIHDFRISTEVVTLMAQNNINSIDVKGTIKEILPGTKCP
ncbi:MAG: hypothetical protein UZ19_OD1000989 [Parcubacteria bacterium OLB19]|nr:MAG: hypothetical protein UZ19_OD1000989 [Parcubacteria bacterium OLB19]